MTTRPRAQLFAQLDRLVARSWRDETRPAVALVVVDVEPSLGPALGEERVEAAMRGVADELAAGPLGRNVHRFGALELIVVAEHVPDGDALARMVGEIEAAVARAGRGTGLSEPLRARVGAAATEPGQRSVTRLLDAADAALGGPREAANDVPSRLAHALAALLGVREGVTPSHCWHVATLSRRLASRLGLDSEAARRCQLAGLLHDVGKLAVPEDVLLKPAALDESEWQHMRRHPGAGADMLAGVPHLREVAPAVLHHHEWYDGTGYPIGLAGEDIPLEARVVAVADAYSAVTAERPYRASRSTAEAAHELRRAAGSQLDPNVVDALLAEIACDALAA